MHLRQFYGATFLATALTSVAAELALDVDLDLGILDLDVNISVDAELSKNKYDFVIVGSTSNKFENRLLLILTTQYPRWCWWKCPCQPSLGQPYGEGASLGSWTVVRPFDY